MKKIILLSLTLLLLAGTAALVYAGSTSIDWDVIAGGGGSTSSGDVTIEDTIGQPVVGASQAGDVAIDSGFWPGLQAATPTGAPTDTPTPTPTGAPTDTPTPTPTGASTDTPTPTPTSTPTRTPTSQPGPSSKIFLPVLMKR